MRSSLLPFSAPRALLLAAALPLLLSACGGMPKTGSAPSTGSGTLDTSGDGPPALTVRQGLDVDGVPDAIPRIEPRSRYGNPKFYEVEGRRYYVLASNEGYKERGIASWYGTKFHGRRTSSGEPYDMYAMTAAHTTLPIPSYVEVTNLSNGRTVVVKVNDRGPFRHNRLIDLSYVAALKLGIVAEGTGKVEVRAVMPAEAALKGAAASPAAPQLATDSSPAMFLQVGAFADRRNAEQLSQRVAAVAPRGAVKISEQPGAAPRGSLYRVRLGPLSSVDEVDQVSRKLDDLGLSDAHVVID